MNRPDLRVGEEEVGLVEPGSGSVPGAALER